MTKTGEENAAADESSSTEEASSAASAASAAATVASASAVASALASATMAVTAPEAAASVEATLMEPVVVPTAETETAGIASSSAGKEKFAINSSKEEFLALPGTDVEVHSVDTKNGLWLKCVCCDSAMNLKSKPPRPFNMISPKTPFTIGHWNEHKATKSHENSFGALKRQRLEERSAAGKIT